MGFNYEQKHKQRLADETAVEVRRAGNKIFIGLLLIALAIMLVGLA